MDPALTLFNAQIQFLDTKLALIHIPLHLYSSFLQPILQLLWPSETIPQQAQTSNGDHKPRKTWAYDHPFVNISVTPIECSIACSRTLADEIFVPVRDSLDSSSQDQVSITVEDYVVMQVDGESIEAGQRVLELTSPLAMAGIPIFFITTYFSDYILVPLKSRATVISALESRNFVFSPSSSSYISPSPYRHRHASSTSSLPHSPVDDFRPSSGSSSGPSTPPPATVSELQTRTFATLAKLNIAPFVDPNIRLVSCAGRKDSGYGRPATSSSASSSSGSSTTSDALTIGILKCLIKTPTPRFFSLTLTDAEPASVLLERRLLHYFPDAVLLGNTDDVLVPIVLDLRELPFESTGIVCGVAGRLMGQTQGQLGDPVEMSYLSTAKAGTVMVNETELGRAMDALRGAAT